MTAAQSRARGFTLIELMVVTAIIGLLASVAVPVYVRATLRARTAERGTILQSMRTGIEDAFVRNLVPPGGLHGNPNPAGVPGPSKRAFRNMDGDWRLINVVVQGDTYYTYEFVAVEAQANTAAIYTMSAVGDLDGDTAPSEKQFVLARTDGRWAVQLEDPPAGQEDDLSPDRTF